VALEPTIGKLVLPGCSSPSGTCLIQWFTGHSMFPIRHSGYCISWSGSSVLCGSWSPLQAESQEDPSSGRERTLTHSMTGSCTRHQAANHHAEGVRHEL
jgi:hypothetical protein